MQTKEMLSLYGVAKTAFQSNNGALINVQKTYLTGKDNNIYVNNLRGNVYVFQYAPQSLQEIVDAMNVTLGKKKANMITEFSFSANKEYKVPIIGERYYSVERNETVPNFAGQTQSQVKAWCDQRSITMYVNYVHEGDELYDSTLTEGTVVGQNVIKGKLVKDINSITINVVTHYNPDATTSVATTESTTTESTTTGATTPAEETIEE
jgi:beta-lactam-binding protein with PASTA domain